MNTTLYERSEELKALNELIEMDLGEITEEHEELVSELMLEIQSKTDSVVLFSQHLEDEIEMAKKRKDEITNFIKARENAIQRLKDYVQNCMDMSNTKSFSGDLYEIKERKPAKSLYIADDSLVPVEFTTVEQVVKVDKAGLKKAVKNGDVSIDGIKLVDGKRSISFKTKSVSKKGGRMKESLTTQDR